MDSAYIFETFGESHYARFNVLYQNAFHATMNLNEFTERFNTKARGFDFVGFMAIDRETGHAAAFYGVFPLKIKIGQSTFPAAISGDTMTHSQHRNKGLFRILATMTYEQCRKLGIVLIYGFPNDQSYHGFIHSLGWKHANDLTEWNLSLRFKISPVHKILKHAEFLRPLFYAYAHRLLKKYIISNMSSFNNNHGGAYGIVSRDHDYIAYKRSKERMFIKIENVIIWIKLSSILWIGDFSDLEQVSKPVMGKMKKLARLLGYNSIRYAVNQEISLPESMGAFEAKQSIPSCLLYLEEGNKFPEFLFTSADFDTW